MHEKELRDTMEALQRVINVNKEFAELFKQFDERITKVEKRLDKLETEVFPASVDLTTGRVV